MFVCREVWVCVERGVCVGRGRETFKISTVRKSKMGATFAVQLSVASASDFDNRVDNVVPIDTL